MRKFNLKFNGIEKLAFLAVLFATVLLAKLLTDERSKIQTGNGIKLLCDKLEVALPHGNNWRALESWQADRSSFFLTAAKYSGNNPVAIVKLTYNLEKKQFSPELFANKLDGFSTIEKEAIEESNGLKFAFLTYKPDLASLQSDKTSSIQNSIYGLYGFCNLETGRSLEIQIDTIESLEIAEKIFSTIVKQIHYSNDGLLDAAAKVISAIQTKGADPAKIRYSNQSFNFILDESEKNVGFRAEFINKANGGCGGSMQMNIFDFIQLDAGQLTQNDSFEFLPDLSCYSLKSRLETTTFREPQIVELKFSNGQLNINNLSNDSPQSLSPLGWSIPHQLYIELASEFALSSYGQIQPDLIDSRGIIIPTLLTKQILPSPQGNDYIVRFKSLDGKEDIYEIYISWQGLYLGYKSISEKLSLKTSTKEQIYKVYPHWQSWLKELGKN